MWQRQVGSPGHPGQDTGADRRRRASASPTPAPWSGGRLTDDAVSALQGSVGNAAVVRMLRPDATTGSPVPVQRIRSDEEESDDGAEQPPQQPQPHQQQPHRRRRHRH
ncbi:hypothetical protein [Embleya sp. NPDC001921]